MYSIDKNKKNDVESKSQEAGTASLGTIAKSSPTSSNLQQSEGQKLRSKRYKLLKKARALFINAGLSEGLDIPTKYHRTSLCKHACTGSAGVGINLLVEAKKGFYTGLQTCGSVWTCPVCANKIQEVRRLEIASAMKYFYHQKKQAVMITITFPHNKKQSLAELLSKFSEALKMFRKGGAWSRKMKSFGYEGLIRSLEVMHGANGWHPHNHELWFLDEEIDHLEFQEFINNKWLEVCIKAGLVDSEDIEKQDHLLDHGIDIKFNCSTSEYLAKFDDGKHWGVDREMAKSSNKKSQKNGSHPFALLDENKDSLFLEYAEAIKGKAQIYWSQGLKKKVGILEITDEEAAEKEADDLPVFVGLLSKLTWDKVTSKELRAEVLDLTESKKTIEEIRSFIFENSKMNDHTPVRLKC